MRPITLVKRALRLGLRKAGVTLSTKVLGQRIYYDPSTDIGLELLRNGKFEQREIDICAQFIQPNSVVLDVGANIGLHAVAFAKRAVSGLVIAVEPSPRTYQYLLRNTDGMHNVLTLNVALSSKRGIVDFFETEDNAYSSLKDTKRKVVSRKISAPCFDADYILRPLLTRPLDFVKIDVEGFETEVLLGMRALIEEGRPAVLCEIYRGTTSNPDPERTVRVLLDMGYSAYVFDRQRLSRYQSHNDALYNYLFVPTEKGVRFATLRS